MTIGNRLSASQIQSELKKLNHASGAEWKIQQDKLYKQFAFNDFADAMQFMQKVAEEADKIDHHPEWCNVYNRVTVNLTTHSAGGITELDFQLASKMQELG